MRLFGLGVRHAVLRLVLLGLGLALVELPVGNLLVLLNDGAAAAEPRDDEIADAVTLEVELLTDIGPLHRGGDAGAADAAGSQEEQALW